MQLGYGYDSIQSTVLPDPDRFSVMSASPTHVLIHIVPPHRFKSCSAMTRSSLLMRLFLPGMMSSMSAPLRVLRRG